MNLDVMEGLCGWPYLRISFKPILVFLEFHGALRIGTRGRQTAAMRSLEAVDWSR
jgi:hypothetical protein